MSILSSQSCGTYNANILKERSPYLISTVTGKEEEEEEEEASKLYNQIQPFRKDWLTPIAFCFIVAGCQGAIFFSTVKESTKKEKPMYQVNDTILSSLSFTSSMTVSCRSIHIAFSLEILSCNCYHCSD